MGPETKIFIVCKYFYGGSGDNGTIIKQDDTYYYYDLTLSENYCIYDNNEFISNVTQKLVFGVNKRDYTDLVFIDTAKANAFPVVKLLE